MGLPPGDRTLIIDDDDDRVRETYGLGGGFADSAVTGETGSSGSHSGKTMSSTKSSESGRGGGRSTIASRSYCMKISEDRLVSAGQHKPPSVTPPLHTPLPSPPGPTRPFPCGTPHPLPLPSSVTYHINQVEEESKGLHNNLPMSR